MNIAGLMHEQAERQGSSEAIIVPRGSWYQRSGHTDALTFAEIRDRSLDMTESLRAEGVKQGDRILLFMKPSLEFPVVAFALLQMGAIPVFIDPGMGLKSAFNCMAATRPVGLIAEPSVHLVKQILKSKFSTIKIAISTAKLRPFQFGALSLSKMLDEKPRLQSQTALPVVGAQDTAAIVFTSGATGPAKGVVYTHANFARQIHLLKNLFKYTSKDRDLSAFPLFSLISIAMGTPTIVPPINPSKPAKVNPKLLTAMIREYRITTAGGSPAIWKRVAEFCRLRGITLPSLRTVMMFGAPISIEMIDQWSKILPNGTTFTPYGATESLPITCISGDQLLSHCQDRTKNGEGTCVGRAVEGTQVKIIRRGDQGQYSILGENEVGEIIVSGDQVTQSYWERPQETKNSKILDDSGKLWHCIGDYGYLDHEKKLWFCGRKNHAVSLTNGITLYSVQCEAIFNRHPAIERSALITIKDRNGAEKPAIAIERKDKRVKLSSYDKARFKVEIEALANKWQHTAEIHCFYLCREFPVDTRHNIKIDRIKLGQIFSQSAAHSL